MRTKMNNADVFVVNPNKPLKTDRVRFSKDRYSPNEELDVTFCLKGYHDTLDDFDNPVLMDLQNTPAHERREACARKRVKNTVVKYYIKISNRGEYLNPLDRQFINYATKMENNIPVWQFREVTKKAFESYLTFLRTENAAYLNLAIRSV